MSTLIDEEQPVALGQRIKVGAERHVVESGTAMQHDHRGTAASLDHVQSGVADVDQLAITHRYLPDPR